MTSDSDPPKPPGGEFVQDFAIDKPGIVGARWWHQGLVEEDRRVSRRQALTAFGVAGAGLLAMGGFGAGVYALTRPEPTGLDWRQSLEMQKLYGWDFGARGTPLVFNGVAEGPFDRAALSNLAAVMAPATGSNAKYHVPTLVESLTAQPTSTLPDPEDGLTRPDGAPFRRLIEVIVPIVTPEMRQAYAAGEALARVTLPAKGRPGLAVLADMPGHQAVAFAAGAASMFEPVLLLDNWPHPQGVVPSHLTLAALAYYQPRFAATKARSFAPPLFVLDRLRTASYSEEGTRFDNRYFARLPRLDVLARDGVRTLFYVVASPAALPEPDDLNGILAAPAAPGAPAVEVRALAFTDFRRDPQQPETETLFYGGSSHSEAGFWSPDTSGGGSATSDHRFARRAPSGVLAVGRVPVVATRSGLILSGALDRNGSMNRFRGGWGG